MTTYDFSEVYAGLKDFQLETVDYVFQRMYLDENPAKRFLVADEVGLGKTLVARGLIARAIEHLAADDEKRIDIVYICSNGDIARQNINRLNVTKRKDFSFSSRITLLATKLHNLTANRLNFVSFTPGTSFDLKGSLGIQQERMLLYWLVKAAWPELVGSKKGPKRVFQGGVTNFGWWEDRLRKFRPTARAVDRGLHNSFLDALDEEAKHAALVGAPSLRERFEELATEWAHERKHPETHRRNQFVGDLRKLLARTCVEALEPDLIILDEFQRFKHLLEGETDAAQLAHELFDYSGDAADPRVLLLSATPYKMYTLSEESESDDHYADFLRTVSFLMPEGLDEFTDELHRMRMALLALDPDRPEALIAAKTAVENRLCQVMCRTERLAVTEDRTGMLTEVGGLQARMEAGDARAFVGLDGVASQLEAQNQMEFWKSAPYFPNFWNEYQIGKRFNATIEDDPDTASDLRRRLRDSGGLISWGAFESYRRIDPANARLRTLVDDLIENDAWKLLWLPPALPYHSLGPPFDKASDANLTKRLVFSSWNVVPKVVSTLLSFEAERRMMKSSPRTNLANSAEGRSRFTEPLRFPTRQTSGMSAFAFMYPSPALGRLADPADLANQTRATGIEPTSQAVVKLAGERAMTAIRSRVADLGIKTEGPPDDRWYWIAALVLDFDPDDSIQEDWLYPNNIASWTGQDSRSGGAGFMSHLELVRSIERNLRGRTLEMGSFPDDLDEVLGLLGVAGPGTVAYRSLSRMVDSPDVDLELKVRDTAMRIAWGFRSLFNTPEVTQLIRGLERRKGAYWQQALRYGAKGCLQAVMDEYFYVLKGFEGLVGALDGTAIEILGKSIAEVVELRAADLWAQDPLDSESPVRRMRTRFALPFGQHRSEDLHKRSDFVRTAFNSPFWPFVLTTTSIGQEGLDFHLYCHAVVHWNLPSNPVDLEQREGRVHRYLGHAVRKNLAHRFGSATDTSTEVNPWDAMLKEAVDSRRTGVSDLVPYWVFPGPSAIERHVPRVALSREDGRLEDLKRSLAIYRLVFGQPRQEDLMKLIRDLKPETAEKLKDIMRVDLSPVTQRETT